MLRFRSNDLSLLRRWPGLARIAVLLCGWVILWPWLHPFPVAPQSKASRGRIVQQGIAVQWELEPVAAQSERTGGLLEGEDVTFRFTITDTTTGAPVRGANPAAWLDLRRQTGVTDCVHKVAVLSGAGLLNRSAIDLNTYYVLAMNQDATISVVDPRFQFGGSKLLALVALTSPGVDWALTADQSKLFVSLPEAHQVAVIETASWQVVAQLPVGPQPARLGIQPDGRYLWVSYGAAADAEDSGVAIFTVADLKLAARIPTGGGPHELAFSDDSRFAFVSNQGTGQGTGQETGTVTLIEIARLAKIKELATGRKPVSLTFSKSAQAAYLVDEVDGSIVAVDALRQKIIARLQLDPGLRQLKFAPGERFGLVINSARNQVQVLDASINRIVQTATVKEEPTQIAFSDKMAYIRHRRSEQVLMIPLDQLGRAGQPLAPADFPGGQNPFGKISRASLAETIIPAPGAGAMLVANPADQAIYYSKLE